MSINNLFLKLVFCIGSISCSVQTAIDKKQEFVRQLEELEEMKIAKIRIDSLKSEGILAQISISIVDQSFYSEDSLKNISLAFINQNFGFAEETLYIVKFDSDNMVIVSVEKNKPD